jgi:glycosyltransferase involved in cell wall biosynthesis
VHIAVVIPAFNLAPYLRDCLLSVVDQTHADWSVVVVDDGSTDATGAIAARFNDRRITLIQQENAGVSAARNTAIGLLLRHNRALSGEPGIAAIRNRKAITTGDHNATGTSPGGTSPGGTSPRGALPENHAAAVTPDAILFLDGDDWLAPNALALLAETLETSPWAVAACCRYARVALTGRFRLSPSPPEGNLLERLLTRNLFANGGHILIRREAIEAAGDFRPRLTYGEDWDYWTRLAVLGEFIAVRSRAPLLFVRERAGSACLSFGTDPEASRPALDAIYRNPAIIDRIGDSRLAVLRRRANAETAWAVGRELIRHGNQIAGRKWLATSIQSAPDLKRLALIILSRFRFGPFHPY